MTLLLKDGAKGSRMRSLNSGDSGQVWMPCEWRFDGALPFGPRFRLRRNHACGVFPPFASIANARRQRLRPFRASPFVVELFGWFVFNRLRQTHERGMLSRPGWSGSVKREGTILTRPSRSHRVGDRSSSAAYDGMAKVASEAHGVATKNGVRRPCH